MAFVLQRFDAPSGTTVPDAAAHVDSGAPSIDRATVVRVMHGNRDNRDHGWRRFGDPKRAHPGAVVEGLRRRPQGH